MPKELVYEHDQKDDGPQRYAKVQWGGALSREVFLATREMDANGDESVGLGTVVQLDRMSINGMIRVLRRARDQAFGRDE